MPGMTLFFLKQRACKPDSVPAGASAKDIPAGFHHLSCPSIAGWDHSTYPPASDEQSSSPVYMVFQPMMCTAPCVAAGTGELLPHLFTLTGMPAVIFCYITLLSQTASR